MSEQFTSRAFRDPSLVKQLVIQINDLAQTVARRLARPVQLMEVCGGHTHAIFHSGINQLISTDLEFIHGPGCPVCVLPAEAIGQAAAIAKQSNTILASFGDVLRVPGSQDSLQQIKAMGADIRVLYSPFDAIELAQKNPDKQVVFFAIGFDTTMPSIAFTILEAKRRKLANLRFLCYHIRLLPTLTTLLDRRDVKLDGFIGPGHVSIVLGSNIYNPIAEKYNKPMVIAGFEPIDFLQAVLQLLLQLLEGRCEIENAYTRVVTKQGNLAAQNVMERVFENSVIAWRGMGNISQSVGSLKADYAMFDASIGLTPQPVSEQEPAYCAQVLIGKRKPDQCPYFRKTCNPDNPLGALMVSSEGACAAYYKYKQKSNESTKKGTAVNG